MVTGLAWTSVGGDILFIESILSKGKGALNYYWKFRKSNEGIGYHSHGIY